MKKLALYGGALSFALFLALAGVVTRDAHTTPSAYAQAATTATATAADTTTTQPVQQQQPSNPFPYGLLGLLGLAGLAGLRRPQPVTHETRPGEAKVYDNRK